MFLPLLLNFAGVVGGTHSFAHACHKIFLENGGKRFTKHEVEKVLIENGVAKGMRLKNMSPTGNWAVIDVIPGQTGKYRPIPELALYTTPVKKLYCTGSAWGFTGAATDAQAYNCYKAVAQDFDVQKPWEEDGRPF